MHLLSFDIGLTGYLTLLDIKEDYFEIIESRQFIVEEKSDFVLSKTKSKSVIKNQINIKENIKVINSLIDVKKEKIFGLMEQVTPRQNYANSAIMSLGDTFASSRAIFDCLDIKYKVIPPKTWKTALNLTNDKKESLDLLNDLIKAKRIVCKKNKTYTNHNQVESILIAYFFFSEVLKK